MIKTTRQKMNNMDLVSNLLFKTARANGFKIIGILSLEKLKDGKDND